VYGRGKVYAIGGSWKHGTADRKALLKTCEVYSIKHNKWSMIAQLNEQRSLTNSLFYNNRLYVFGGYRGDSPTQTIERYNELSD